MSYQITLHYITLYYIAFHHITLHYITDVTLLSLKNTLTKTFTAPLIAFLCKYEAYVIFLSRVSVWGRWQKSKKPPMYTVPWGG